MTDEECRYHAEVFRGAMLKMDSRHRAFAFVYLARTAGWAPVDAIRIWRYVGEL